MYLEPLITQFTMFNIMGGEWVVSLPWWLSPFRQLNTATYFTYFTCHLVQGPLLLKILYLGVTSLDQYIQFRDL